MKPQNSFKRFKPKLPMEIQQLLPVELVHLIQSYVPYTEVPKPPSPSLQKELAKIQKLSLKGKSSMYMNNLDDFCLD
jgi:hypothetical protein